MLLRIGLNVGDVVVDGDDILGDGVNIAARLQEITDAGGVTVAATAYEHLADKFDLAIANIEADTEQHLPLVLTSLLRSAIPL
jgi:class 3 adenylate cyclase